MTPLRRLGAVLSLAGLSLGLASATSGGSTDHPSSDQSPTAAASLPQGCYKGLGNKSCYTMTVSLKGAVKWSGHRSVSELASCPKYLKSVAGGGTEVELPLYLFNGSRDELLVNLENWKGPGVYPISSSITPGSRRFMSVTVQVGPKSYNALHGTKPATGSATALANGSVTFHFAGLTASGAPAKTESGSAVYHCLEI